MPQIEALLTQLLIVLQHQSMEIARLQDELQDFRQRHDETATKLSAEIAMVGKRSDWFSVQISDVLKVALREIREIRTTQVFTALSEGPISAEQIAELVHRSPEEELLLELPKRAAALNREA
jgi:hypothetical protein